MILRTIEPQVRKAALAYQRGRDLPRLIAFDDQTVILERLERELQTQRTLAARGHWSYDLNRHIALLGAYRGEVEMKRKEEARLRARADELRAQIESYVFSGRPVPDDLIKQYDDAELNDERGYHVFTLCEQASLPRDERDPGWSWVPEITDEVLAEMRGGESNG